MTTSLYPFQNLSQPLESFRLANGLSVVLHRFASPAVGFAFFVRAGPAFESRETNGVSHFLEHMLFRGVPAHPSSEELTLALDRVGAEANAATYTDLIALSCKILPESVEEALALFRDMVTAPVFAGLDAEREIILEEFLEDFDEDGTLTAIDQLSSQLLYRTHPYALPILGNKEFLQTLTIDDLRGHLARFFQPGAGVLCLSGALGPTPDVRGLIERTFGRMNPGDGAATAAVPPLPPFRGPRLNWVDSPRSQIQCRISFLGWPVGDPDFVLQKALVRLLDNPSGSPLRQAMQDEKGFCYSLAVGLDAYAAAGAVHVDFSVKPERLIDAVYECLRVLARTAERPPSDGIVEHMIHQYVKGKRFAASDLWDFSGRVGFRALFPTAQPFEEEFVASQRVTARDLARLARRLFRPSRLGVTLVGPCCGSSYHRLARMIERFPG